MTLIKRLWQGGVCRVNGTYVEMSNCKQSNYSVDKETLRRQRRPSMYSSHTALAQVASKRFISYRNEHATL